VLVYCRYKVVVTEFHTALSIFRTRVFDTFKDNLKEGRDLAECGPELGPLAG
jgi:hypothetical protein